MCCIYLYSEGKHRCLSGATFFFSADLLLFNAFGNSDEERITQTPSPQVAFIQEHNLQIINAKPSKAEPELMVLSSIFIVSNNLIKVSCRSRKILLICPLQEGRSWGSDRESERE